MTGADARAASLPHGRGRARDRLLFLAIFVLALVLRVVATLQYQSAHPNAEHPVIDEASYDRWGQEIARGEWLGHEVFFQEPLYPYTLGVVYAVAGPERLVVRLLQCVLGAALTLIVGRLATRVFGRNAGLLSALAVALYWPGLLFPSLLLKENLFVPLFALFAAVLVATRTAQQRRLAWFFVGALGALGALLRGNMLVLLPAFVLWPCARAWCEERNVRRAVQRAWTHSALVVVGIAAVLGPVALRNYKVGGVLVLSTSGAGTNLYGGNNLENPYGRASEFSFMRGIPEFEAADWKHEAERRSGRALDPAQVSAFWRDETLRSLRAEPWQHVRILWNKLRLSLGSYEVPDNHLLYWDARYVPLAQLPFPGFGVVGVFGLAGIGIFLLRKQLVRAVPESSCAASIDVGAATELCALFLLYLATIVLTVTSERARLPLMPLLACFAGASAVCAWSALRSGSRALAWTAAPFAVACVIVLTPVFDARTVADDYDERDYNLAAQWLADEHTLDAALPIAQRLADAHPQSARMQSMLAEIDFKRAHALLANGRRESRAEASELLERALLRVEHFADDGRLNQRERNRAQTLVAFIQLERNAWDEAQRRLRQAQGFDPASKSLRLGLAHALLGSNDAAEQQQALANADEALAILTSLASEQDVEGRDELELSLARAQYQRGRALLAVADRTPEQQAAGQQSIRDALARLSALARSGVVEDPTEARARKLAGWIQLYLQSYRAAENHFRACLKLAADPEAELGLAQSLVSASEEAQVDERAQKLAEARGLLERLAALDPQAPAVIELRARIERLQ